MAIIDVEKGMAEVTGTEIRDTINLISPVGNGIIINSNAGSDIIKVTKGDNHIINAGKDNDFIDVSGGSNYVIDLGEGDDTLRIYGKSGHVIKAVSGTNNITINGGSDMNISGGTGIDKLIIKGTNSNNKVSLGVGDDFIGLATGTGNILHADEGNDQIIISGTGGEGNIIYGDAGNDKFKIYVGTNNIYDAGEGDDSILITGSSNNTVYGGDGKNQTIIMGGSDNVYYGGDTKDNITIKSQAQAVTVNAGAGATVVNIQAGNDHVINLGEGDSVTQILAGENIQVNGAKGKDTFRAWGTVKSLQVDLGEGNDRIILEAGTKHIIKGGAGKDSFTIFGTTNNSYFDAGADDDTIELRGGGFNTLEAGDGNDVITISGGSNTTLNAGDGDDRVTVKGGALQPLDLGAGNDQLTITAGNIRAVNGGDGDDTLSVAGGSVSKIEGGTGNDNIAIKSGTVALVDGGDGDDILTASNGMALTLKGGAGSDIYAFANLREYQVVQIDNSGNGEEDADTIDLSDYNQADINFIIENTTAVITYAVNNAQIKIKEWFDNNVAKVTLSEGDFAAKDLFKDLVIKDGATYGTIGFVDNSDAAMSGYNVVLENGTVGNVIGVSNTQGDVAHNFALIKGGVIQGENIIGAKTELGAADDNKVIIQNSTYDGNIYGGYSVFGKATNNFVNIEDSIIKGDVYSSVGAANETTGNMGITIIENTQLNGTVYGGIGAASISILGNSSVGAVKAEAGDDDIMLYGGSLGLLDAGEGNDTIRLNGGEVNYVAAGEGNDTILVAGGTASYLAGGKGSDTYSFTNLQPGQNYVIVNNDNDEDDIDTLALDNYEVKDFEAEIIEGNGVLTHKATRATITLVGWDLNSNNVMNFRMGTFGGMELFDAQKTLVIKDGLDHGLVVFKDSEKGDLTGYSVVLEKGTTNDIVVASVADGTAFNNSVRITGGTVYGDVYGSYGFKTASETAKANINNANIIQTGGTIMGDVYAAVTYNGKAMNNTITFTGSALVEGNVYTSKGTDNLLEDNLGTITLDGYAQIKGTITGGVGKDKVNISGRAQTADIKLGDGDDNFTIDTDYAVLGKVDMGNDNDTIVIMAGNNLTAEGGRGDDLINIMGGTDIYVSGGYGNDIASDSTGGSYYDRGRDTISISGGDRITADGGYASDLFQIYGGNNITVLGGHGDDVFEVKNGSYITIEGGYGHDNVSPTSEGYWRRGMDSIKISGGSHINIDGGSDDDYVEIKGGQDILAQGGWGNDTFVVSGGSDITLEGGYGQDLADEIKKTYWSRGDDTFTITGGSNITIEAGGGNDFIEISGGINIQANGGIGNDEFIIAGGDQITLAGGHSDDIFKFTGLQQNANYIIDFQDNYLNECDVVDLSDFAKNEFDITRNQDTIILTHTNGATITIKDWHNRDAITLKFADGEYGKQSLFDSLPAASANNQVEVISSFMKALDYTNKSSYAALDEAVAYASMGRFENLADLVEDFKAQITAANINTFQDTVAFYEEYCGIILDNTDTGAITGADCGGPEVKGPTDIVVEPEGITLEDFVCDRSHCIMATNGETKQEQEFYAKNVNGITLYWDDSDWNNLLAGGYIDEKALEQVMGGILNAWMDGEMNLIEESYGIGLNDPWSSLQTLQDGTKGLQINLYYEYKGSALATHKQSYVNGEYISMLNVNMYYYAEGVKNVDGYTLNNGYLDRIIAHEMVHAVMAANIVNFSSLPVYVKEGLAELVHGIDDFRTSAMKDWIIKEKDNLDNLFSLTDPTYNGVNTHSYTGGYTLMRYFAKQVSDFVNGGASAYEYDFGAEKTNDFLEPLKISGNL